MDSKRINEEKNRRKWQTLADADVQSTVPDDSTADSKKVGTLDDIKRRVTKDGSPFANTALEEFKRMTDAEIRERWQKFVTNDPFPKTENVARALGSENNISEGIGELTDEELRELAEGFFPVRRDDVVDNANHSSASLVPEAVPITISSRHVVMVEQDGDPEEFPEVVVHGRLVTKGIQWGNSITDSVPWLTPRRLLALIFILVLLTLSIAIAFPITVLRKGKKKSLPLSSSPSSSLLPSFSPTIISHSPSKSVSPSFSPTFISHSPSKSNSPSFSTTFSPTFISHSPSKSVSPSFSPTFISHSPSKSNSPSFIPTFPLLYINPTKDSYVKSGDNRGKNYGSAVAIIVKNSNNPQTNREAIIEFDLSPFEDYVFGAATLRLQVMKTTGPFSVLVSRLHPTTWSEDTVTWNDYVPFSKMRSGGMINGEGESDIGKIFDVDVTSLLQASDNPIVTLHLEENILREIITDFASRESVSGMPPQLVLERL